MPKAKDQGVQVQRIEVTGGFLDGIELDFTSGFNALIGARGTGKTSVIELIRFALDLPLLTERLRPDARKQAEAILSDGAVTLTVTDGNAQFVVSRSPGEPPTTYFPDSGTVLVLAQNEIEGIGKDSASRLQLVDGFIGEKQRAIDYSELIEIEAELASLAREIAAFDEQLASFSPAVEELVAARATQAQSLAQRTELKREEAHLQELSRTAQQFAKALEHGRRVRTDLARWEDQIRKVADATPDIRALDRTLFGEVWKISDRITGIRPELEDALARVRTVRQALEQNVVTLEREAAAIEGQARPIRARLEQAQKGAGELAKRITLLEQRVAQGEAIAELRQQRASRYDGVRTARSYALDELDRQISERSIAREQVAQFLTRHLRPAIRVEIAQKSNVADYITAVGRCLRGTGMHAATLAEQIAKKISPRQLVEFIEAGDRASLARIVGISVDRAQRLINALSTSSLGAILNARVEDDVRISLLVGPDYKAVEDLSTGQRCTAIIPILLSRTAGTLIIDQPEDHLDNAYIVDTLVAAVKNRSRDLQVIFSSHNANLPVLGGADRVVEMASDGIVGFPRVIDVLDSDPVVNAITSVMEGGREAFARRAAFYDSHPDASAL